MPALLHATSRKHLSGNMEHATWGRESAHLSESVCRDLNRECLPVGSVCKLAPAANVDRYRLPFRRPAQLVRSTLFPHAPAGALWPLAKLLHRCVLRDWIAHAGVCFAAGALLREHLVRRE